MNWFSAIAAQIITFSLLGTPVAVEPVASEVQDIVELPIHQVSLDKQDEKLILWVEGDRLDGCDLPVESSQTTEHLENGITAIRVRMIHRLEPDFDCAGEWVNFNLDVPLRQPIEPRRTYHIWVNDYNFTVRQN